MTRSDNGSSDQLNARQEQFCQIFVTTGNQTIAYMESYGIQNERSASAAASRLLKNVNVRNRIRELRDELFEPRILSIKQIQSKLSDVLTNPETTTGNQIAAAKTLLQSLGGLKTTEISQNVTVDNSDYTEIWLPPISSVEENEIPDDWIRIE